MYLLSMMVIEDDVGNLLLNWFSIGLKYIDFAIEYYYNKYSLITK